MGDILKFPTKPTKPPVESYLDKTAVDNSHTIIHFAVDLLREEGYDINNEQFTKDMGLIANFLYATQVRCSGEQHMLGDVMDDIQRELEMLKKVLDDIT